MRLHLLHGFCGSPQDWSEFQRQFQTMSSTSVHAHDLWQECPPSEFTTLASAVEKLASSIEEESYFLMGYSLGGRIALHWPQTEWHKVRGMILLSTHWGLSSKAERTERFENDQKWSENFLSEDWNSLQLRWNQQEVFRYDVHRPQRQETDFSRLELSCALRHWSLAQQKDFLREGSYSFPVLSVCGSQDQKFLLQNVKISQLKKEVECQTLPGGHSLHINTPLELAKMTKEFIMRVER